MQVLTGQYFSLSGTLLDASGNVVQDNTNPQPTFVSSAPNIVALTLLPTGLYRAQALAAGSSTITATYGSVTQTLAVTVVDTDTPASIQINVGYVSNNPN